MLLLLLLFAPALGDVTPPDVRAVGLQRGLCPSFWYSFNNRCYKYVSSRMTWLDAELHCVSHGGNLVSIHSLREENFVKNLIKLFDPAQSRNWLGLSDQLREGTWMWSDGSPVDFTFWEAGEPNDHYGQEDCVHNNFERKLKWNDVDCAHAHTFVCKLQPTCF